MGKFAQKVSPDEGTTIGFKTLRNKLPRVNFLLLNYTVSQWQLNIFRVCQKQLSTLPLTGVCPTD